ncbi:MAG: hypothetical protein HY821_05835 [Acidobacteria bacterium]|nr:hypothetical protein [Acidobacteriota bacterium]
MRIVVWTRTWGLPSLMLALCGAAAAQDQRYSITGTLYLVAAPNALPNRSVTLTGTLADGRPISDSAQTDAYGVYTFTAIPAQARVTVTPRPDWSGGFAYAPATWTQTMGTGVTGTTYTADFFLQASPGTNYTVTGTLWLVEAPNFLPNRNVVLSGTLPGGGTISRTATTNDHGLFLFADLPAQANVTLRPEPDPGGFSYAPVSWSQTIGAGATNSSYVVNLFMQPPPGSGYTITGTLWLLSTPAYLPDKSVTLTGTLANGSSISATTRSSTKGIYVFTGIPSQARVTVRPEPDAGFGYSPVSWTQTMGVGSSNSTYVANFSENIMPTVYYQISGKITAAGVPMQGVLVQLNSSTSAQSMVTGAQGEYAFTVANRLENISVTPAMKGYAFTPASFTQPSINSNVVADFTGRDRSFTISGNVTAAGRGVNGVAMNLTGASSLLARTVQNGDYRMEGVAQDGAYVLTPSKSGYTFVPPSQAIAVLDGAHSFSFTAVAGSNGFTLSKASLRFGATTGGNATPASPLMTPPQEVIVTFLGTPNAWTAVASQPWLKVTPTSGSGSARLTVSVNQAALPARGSYTGVIAITAGGSTLELPCSLAVDAPAQVAGYLDTPISGSTGMAGPISVTGWALDTLGLTRVTIWRDRRFNEGGVFSPYRYYVGEATFVTGARPDVEAKTPYRDWPMSDRAGWGYSLLSNTLPGGGNGQYTIHVYAESPAAGQLYLGSTSITVDNANATLPFGTIDLPRQGEQAGGAAYQSGGWVLAVPPASVPADGSTISVQIDGQGVGQAGAGFSRPDVFAVFPNYLNANNAGHSATLDTTRLLDGMHIIAWSVRDSAGRTGRVGYSWFEVQNSVPVVRTQQSAGVAAAVQPRGVVRIRLGDDPGTPLRLLRAGGAGLLEAVEVEELERLELRLPEGVAWTGAMAVGEERRPLPPGSSLSEDGGSFFWQLGPGLLGEYRLEFLPAGTAEEEVPLSITVRVVPKGAAGGNGVYAGR